MASRISQMRNGLQPYPQTPQFLQQQALNESVKNIRSIMSQIKNSSNQSLALEQFLKNNPNTAMIANMLKNNNLEDIAKSMAQAQGIDINTLISQLLGGI